MAALLLYLGASLQFLPLLAPCMDYYNSTLQVAALLLYLGATLQFLALCMDYYNSTLQVAASHRPLDVTKLLLLLHYTTVAYSNLIPKILQLQAIQTLERKGTKRHTLYMETEEVKACVFHIGTLAVPTCRTRCLK